MKGKAKEQWGKLTDDDLNTINGKRDQLEGKIQERYGYAKDQTEKDIDDWCTPALVERRVTRPVPLHSSPDVIAGPQLGR
jgi:uncharacterized protein YjbJ (UPF0337 family)